jgi:hypothetical protein
VPTVEAYLQLKTGIRPSSGDSQYRPANELQLRRRGKLLNAGDPRPRNASSVVPKCHKKAGLVTRLSLCEVA